jgi:hypothetical protein
MTSHLIDNPLVYPKITEIDLETTYVKSLSNAGKQLWEIAYSHKFKTAFLIASLYGTYKTYGFYRSFR